MTYEDKITMTSVMCDETDKTVLSTFLDMAEQAIINIAYPYATEEVAMPSRYGMLQCQIAAYFVNKRGAEGQTGHDENGVKRVYGGADIPDDMLRQIVPHVGVLRSERT